MSEPIESILAHVILASSLSFYESKRRPANRTGKSKYLSSLALILNGDATCTAVYLHQGDKIVFIARNEPITETDERYFDQFFRQIQTYTNLCFDEDKATITHVVKDQLYSLVFGYNSKKIIKRLAGRRHMIIRELEEMVQWDTNKKTRFIEELRSNQEYRDRPLATEKIYFISKKYTEEEYVQFLFHALNKFLVVRDELIEKKMKATDQRLILAASLASMLYESRFFQYILNSWVETAEYGVYYFEKTSADLRSISLLLKCLHHQKDMYGEIYKNISWKLVPSIQEKPTLRVTPKQAFEKIFTKLSHSSNQDICNAVKNITSEGFYNQYLDQMREIDKKPEYDVHVHAEILLIDYLLKNNIDDTNRSKEVEIGISKMSCLLCSYYIDALNRKHDRCFCQTDSTHGKIYQKWTYRNNEDPSILSLVNEKLVDKIQHSIEKLCLKSERAGSQRNGDSDIMFTSMEGDEIDKELYLKAFP